jgi:hypothetical protein
MSTEYIVLKSKDPNGLVIEVSEHSNMFDISICKEYYNEGEEPSDYSSIKDLSMDQLEGLAIKLACVSAYYNPDFIDKLNNMTETQYYNHPTPLVGERKFTKTDVGKFFITKSEWMVMDGIVLPKGLKIKLDYVPSSDSKGYFILNHSVFGTHSGFFTEDEVDPWEN